jgi:hypothetical protein
MPLGSPSSLKAASDWVGSAQRRLVSPGSKSDYAVLFALAAAPLLLSRAFGMAHSASLDFVTKYGSQRVECFGYWDRPNWTTLPLLLPAALFILRTAADRLFKLTNKTAEYFIVPDLTGKKDASSFRAALFDSRNILAACAVTVLLHVIDMRWQFYYFWNGLTRSWAPPAPPSPIWDWTAWFLSQPGNHRLYWENALLVSVAYLAQFLLVLLAISLVVVILRHNLFFLQTIYLRSRPGSADGESFIVLQFDSPDGSFGMRKLDQRFNLQIKLLAAAGIFTLASRLANVQGEQLGKIVSQIKFEQIFSPGKFLDALPAGILGLLFPTTGQKLFAPYGF